MAVIKTPLAMDSAAVLHELIGEDATAMFENDPKFIDSDPTSGSSSENVVLQRDTDDTEDSEEEEEEEEEEEFDEEEEEEDEEEDDFDSDEEEEEIGAIAILASGSTNLRGPVVNGNTSVESELEELEQDDDAGDGTVDEDEYVIEGGDDGSGGSDSPQTDRVIDAALRMSALAAVTSEYAANF
jgi:hypothetical protein